jgi:hypothetical protein
MGIRLEHTPGDKIQIGHKAQKLGKVQGRKTAEIIALDDQHILPGVEAEGDPLPPNFDLMTLLTVNKECGTNEANDKHGFPHGFLFSKTSILPQLRMKNKEDLHNHRVPIK